MDQSELSKELTSLVTNKRFKQLDEYVSPFSLLRAIDQSHDEMTHSDLIASLFDTSEHPHASHAVRQFIREISEELDADNSILRRQLKELADSSLHQVTAHRERERIDVVLEIEADDSAVVGIENKINAGEGHNQISGHQTSLSQLYPRRDKVVVFLTPKGRTSETKDPDSPVPVVSLGYDAIASAARKAVDKAPNRKKYHSPALKELIRHIEEDIMGDSEIGKRARDLWEEHPQALRILMRHRPKLGDVRGRYEELLKASLEIGDDANFNVYPVQRETREIKMRLDSWQARGCEIVFMLHTTENGDAEGRPRLRLLVFNDWYKEHKESLESLASRVNESGSDISIDRHFKKLPGWSSWRRVLQEDLYPDEAVLDPIVIPEQTEDKASEEVTRLFEQLDPHIKSLPRV